MNSSDSLPGSVEVVFYVGTHKLSMFTGVIQGRDPRVLAHREVYQPEGFENGFVTNLEAASNTLSKLIADMLPSRQVSELTASVVLANSKLQVFGFSSAQFYASQMTLSEHEVASVIDQTRSVATLPLTQHVLQVIPEGFLVNDMEDVRNPLGLEAMRLGVNLKMFTMDYQDFKNLAKAFEAADVNVKGYWPRILTVSEAVLTDEEKEEGVILIDIADHITQLAVFQHGKMGPIRNLELGGKQLTAGIARDWEIDFHDAQKVKERFATLEPSSHFGEELIPLISRNGRTSFQIKRQDFQEKFMVQAESWLRSVLDEADQAAQQERINYPHLVFTGGGASFSGFLEFLQQRFKREARIGLSRKMEAPQEVLVDPSLIGALGMYRWLGGQAKDFENLLAPRGLVKKTISSVKKWFYSYF
ncbi:MAG: hypothetical protein FGM27_01755 [Candidatus Omnitrophica bacterium]|nr:hypothetical protein [Candidatus Omnitrophota bacterium]